MEISREIIPDHTSLAGRPEDSLGLEIDESGIQIKGQYHVIQEIVFNILLLPIAMAISFIGFYLGFIVYEHFLSFEIKKGIVKFGSNNAAYLFLLASMILVFLVFFLKKYTIKYIIREIDVNCGYKDINKLRIREGWARPAPYKYAYSFKINTQNPKFKKTVVFDFLTKEDFEKSLAFFREKTA